MKGLFLILVMINILFAESIDTLLKDYEQESDLSKQTKSESAGNLVVFTRDDLERMQVETLSDVLKSLRFFSYQENRLGQADSLNQDPITYYSKSIRVYLNENELFSPIAGSGLILFGNMEMDFIDHIEIYEGFPSFDFGVEPATMVIRLYTKTAKHDEGGRVKAIIGSYGTNKQNAYYANSTEDLSYFIYANSLKNNKEQYEHDNETLKKDRITKRFYSSIENDNHKLELHLLKTEGDAFIGSIVGNIPQETSEESSYASLSLNSKFIHDSLKISLSYLKINSNFSYTYDPLKPVFIPLDHTTVASINSLDQNINEESFTASIKKEWEIGLHTLSTGVQYRYKHFNLTDVTFNIPTPPITQAYFREDIYSFFLQDLISLNENNVITLSIMNQIYDREGSVKNPNTLQLRAGYIYTDKAYISKTFLSRQEFASEPYMTISPHYGNADLKSETYTSLFQEFSYKNEDSLSKMILGYGYTKNLPILSSAFIMENSDEKIEAFTAALEYTLFFREKDKLELQASYVYVSSVYQGIEDTNHYNYVIRSLNSYLKFDIFNELIINTGRSHIDSGYNYSAGVKYQVNPDFHLSFKGVNIFDTALNKRYLNKFSPTLNYVEVPTEDRRFFLSMEYLF